MTTDNTIQDQPMEQQTNVTNDVMTETTDDAGTFSLEVREDHIAVITMDVPGESMNTLRGEFADEITEILAPFGVDAGAHPLQQDVGRLALKFRRNRVPVERGAQFLPDAADTVYRACPECFLRLGCNIAHFGDLTVTFAASWIICFFSMLCSCVARATSRNKDSGETIFPGPASV